MSPATILTLLGQISGPAQLRGRILTVMERNREYTTQDIAQIMGITIHTAGNALGRLEEHGHVSRGTLGGLTVWTLFPLQTVAGPSNVSKRARLASRTG